MMIVIPQKEADIALVQVQFATSAGLKVFPQGNVGFYCLNGGIRGFIFWERDYSGSVVDEGK